MNAPLPAMLHDNPRLDRWIAFPTRGKVTVLTGRVELGQGVLTAMAQIASDELDVSLAPGTDTLEVGGDWYDVFELPGPAVGLVVGDVVGHGLDAAVAMGQLRGAVRALAPGVDLSAYPQAATTGVIFFDVRALSGDVIV